MRKIICLIVAVLCLAMCLAGCGEQHVNERLAIRAFRSAHPNIENVHFRAYYGEYSDGAIVVMMGSGGYFDVVGRESFAGKVFNYGDSCRISVVRDGEIKNLTEAYELGWLTGEDVADIWIKHSDTIAW